MDLIDKIKLISQKVSTHRSETQTEEATKIAFIMPFIEALGYEIFNPRELYPEFTADLPGLKGEKVDYAIFKEDKPIILIECKHIGENIENPKHISQLHRYFHATEAKVGILTNGIVYRFYTDIEPCPMMTSAVITVVSSSFSCEMQTSSVITTPSTSVVVVTLSTSVVSVKQSSSSFSCEMQTSSVITTPSTSVVVVTLSTSVVSMKQSSSSCSCEMQTSPLSVASTRQSSSEVFVSSQSPPAPLAGQSACDLQLAVATIPSIVLLIALGGVVLVCICITSCRRVCRRLVAWVRLLFYLN